MARAIKLSLTHTLKGVIEISSSARWRTSPIGELRTVDPTALPMERTKYECFSSEPGILPIYKNYFSQAMASASPVLMSGIGADCIMQPSQKTTLSAISNACREIARSSFVDRGGRSSSNQTVRCMQGSRDRPVSRINSASRGKS